MDATRRILAILLVVAMPPAVLFWFPVHPFRAFWRRLRPAWTYTFLWAVWVGVAVILFRFRDPLIGRDLGTNWLLIVVGGLLYVFSAWLSVLCRRHLRMSTLAGLPEVSARAYPGRLLQEGVYAVVRHPRYASVILGIAGFAMAVNYAGAYVVVGISLLLLWPVIVLEERELAERFGSEYEAYRRRTPALLPRRRRR